MWIVKLALRRPYTFVVMALLILLLGVASIKNTPPSIIRYNVSSVPILQLALGSKTLTEAQLYDYGIYRVRQAIAPVRGATLPLPYGGKPRQIADVLEQEGRALADQAIWKATASSEKSL